MEKTNVLQEAIDNVKSLLQGKISDRELDYIISQMHWVYKTGVKNGYLTYSQRNDLAVSLSLIADLLQTDIFHLKSNILPRYTENALFNLPYTYYIKYDALLNPPLKHWIGNRYYRVYKTEIETLPFDQIALRTGDIIVVPNVIVNKITLGDNNGNTNTTSATNRRD